MADEADIDGLTLAVRECKRRVDELEDRLAEARVRLAVASDGLSRALGMDPPGGRKAYRDRDAIAKIDVVLMALSGGPLRMCVVSAAAKKLGRPVNQSCVYQLAYRDLTAQAGGGRRKLTAAGRKRLEATLQRPECVAFHEKVKKTLEDAQ